MTGSGQQRYFTNDQTGAPVYEEVFSKGTEPALGSLQKGRSPALY